MTVFKNIDLEEIRNLFSITQRFVMGHTEDSECERNREYWSFMDKIVIISSTSDQVDKDIESRILRLCLVSVKIVRTLTDRNGKISWQIFSQSSLVKNNSILMDIQLSWNGKFSQDKNHRRFCRRSRKIYEIEILSLKILKDQIIFMSMFNDLDWTWKDMKRNIFQISKITRCTRRDSRKDVGSFSTLKMKRNVMEYGNRNYKSDGKWNSVASKMILRSEETGHPIFTGDQRLGSWNPEKSERKETIHLLRMASNKEFLFRIIHSVNKLSIYGAVSNWSGQHGQSLNETESTWEKFNDERRLRESGNTEEYEFTGSKLFRGFFVIESCFWKQIVRGSSEFCFSIRIQSNDKKKLRTSIIWEFEDSWYKS